MLLNPKTGVFEYLTVFDAFSENNDVRCAAIASVWYTRQSSAWARLL